MLRPHKIEGQEPLYGFLETVRNEQWDFVGEREVDDDREAVFYGQTVQLRSLTSVHMDGLVELQRPEIAWTSTLAMPRAAMRLADVCQPLWNENVVKRLLAKYLHATFFDVEIGITIVERVPVEMLHAFLLFCLADELMMRTETREQVENGVSRSFLLVKNRIRHYLMARFVRVNRKILLSYEGLVQSLVKFCQQLYAFKQTLDIFAHRVIECKALLPNHSIGSMIKLMAPVMIHALALKEGTDRDIVMMGIFGLAIKYNLFELDTHTYSIPEKLKEYRLYKINYCCGHVLTLATAKAWFLKHSVCPACNMSGIYWLDIVWDEENKKQSNE